jgi:hypothetical protein
MRDGKIIEDESVLDRLDARELLATMPVQQIEEVEPEGGEKA